MRADRLHDRLVRGRRRREIEEAVRVRPEVLVEAVETLAEGVVAALVRSPDEIQMFGEAAPDLLVQRLRAAVLADGRVQLVAVSLVGERLARRTDDRERRRQQPLQGEGVERGHQLAGGEVPGASED